MVTGDNGIYDAEDIKAAVDEAKKYGMKVTVHAFGGLAATNVITGGAAAIEHGDNLTNEQLQLMKDKGIFLVGTDFSYENNFAYGVGEKTAKNGRTHWLTDLEEPTKSGLRWLSEQYNNRPAEIKPVESSLKLLETWKAAEIPPSYILQTMTIHSAELLGIEKERGILEPNFYADIIALKKNPMENIEAIKIVRFVMKEGKIIRQDGDK